MPSKNRKCGKCHIVGHFQKRCKSKPANPQETDKLRNTEANCVYQVEKGEIDYACIVSNVSENYSSDSSIDVEVGGVIIPMIIDFGASCNILGREQWEQLKSSNVQCVSSKDTKCCMLTGLHHHWRLPGHFELRLRLVTSRWKTRNFGSRGEGTIIVGT